MRVCVCEKEAVRYAYGGLLIPKMVTGINCRLSIMPIFKRILRLKQTLFRIFNPAPMAISVLSYERIAFVA